MYHTLQEYSSRKPKSPSNWSLITNQYKLTFSRWLARDPKKIFGLKFLVYLHVCGHEEALTLIHFSKNVPAVHSSSLDSAHAAQPHRVSPLFPRLAGSLDIGGAGGRLSARFSSTVFQNDIPSDPDTYSRKSAATLSKEQTYGTEKYFHRPNAHVLYCSTSVRVQYFIQRWTNHSLNKLIKAVHVDTCPEFQLTRLKRQFNSQAWQANYIQTMEHGKPRPPVRGDFM